MFIFQQLAWHDLTANLCSCMQQLTVSKHWQGPHIDVHHRRLWQQKNKDIQLNTLGWEPFSVIVQKSSIRYGIPRAEHAMRVEKGDGAPEAVKSSASATLMRWHPMESWTCTKTHIWLLMYVYIYIYMCVYICVCICIYIYMQICIYKHTYNIIQPNLIIFNQQVGCPKNFSNPHPVTQLVTRKPQLFGPEVLGIIRWHLHLSRAGHQATAQSHGLKNAHGRTPKPNRHVWWCLGLWKQFRRFVNQCSLSYLIQCIYNKYALIYI